MEFFYVDYDGISLQAHIIEYGFGPSNVEVVHKAQQDIILIANRQKHEGAVFYTEQ